MVNVVPRPPSTLRDHRWATTDAIDIGRVGGGEEKADEQERAWQAEMRHHLSR